MAFLRPSPPNLIAPSQTLNPRLLFSSSTRTLTTTTTTTTTTIAKTSSRLGFYQHHIPRCSYEASSSAYFNNNSFNGDEDNYKQKEQGGEQVLYPRPSEIPWNKELCNSVHLLGVVGTPVQIKHLTSGKAVAWTRLGVRKSATDTTWINLTFWNELAHVAFQHVEKGNRIYISGRLVSDTVEGDGEKPQTYYKVTVQQLNFVENSFSPVSLYENDSSSVTTGERSVNHTGSNTGSTSTQELWQAFFANPVDWWDNRKNKRNPKYPDFKHKHTGEALWIEGKYNPSWVKSQLAILDSKMESLRANEASSHDSFVSGDDLTFL